VSGVSTATPPALVAGFVYFKTPIEMPRAAPKAPYDNESSTRRYLSGSTR
jgi:hypothetical protein